VGRSQAEEGVDGQGCAGTGSAAMPTVQVPSVPAPQVPASGAVRLALQSLSPDERREQERMQSGDGPLRLGLGGTLRSHQQVSL